MKGTLHFLLILVLFVVTLGLWVNDPSVTTSPTVKAFALALGTTGLAYLCRLRSL